MISSKVMHYVPLVLVALLALTTWLMVEHARIQRGDSDTPNSPLKPDFIVENLRFAKLNQAGELQTLLSAQQMLHIPQTNTASLIEPRMMSFRAHSPPVSISARRGESIRRSEQVNFYEGVVVQRAAAAGSAEMTLRTEQLSVRPDDDIATSETDFTFSRGDSLIQGRGFELNHSFRTLLVRQQARGLFVQGNTP
jgi:lipopolysaccharide export system protein LptC